LLTWFDAKLTDVRMTTTEDNIRAKSTAEDEPQLRDLFLFTAGNHTFGVPAEEVEGTAEAKRATPLPHAPAPIIGVVYARGRMLTLIDPRILAGDEASPRPQLFPAIIALRGDEQLALAADSISETITTSYSDIEPPTEPLGAIAGILRHGGEKISMLDPTRLFDAAVQRKDRRRRRF
jgi:chemotaxis signal transduction protein